MATRRHRTRREVNARHHSGPGPPRSSSAGVEQEKSHAPKKGSRGPRLENAAGADRPDNAASLEQSIHAAALSLLASRSQSEAGLRRSLIARFGDGAAVYECLALLKAQGYLDDSKFAETYAAHRIAVKAIGRARLGRELANKLVSKEDIERAISLAFESTPEEELIDRAIHRRVSSRGVPASPSERKKMFDHLFRLGFPYDLIIRKMRSLQPASDLELEQD